MEPEQVPLQDLLNAVDDADWPLTTNELAEHAKRRDAPDPVLQALRKLPRDRYEGRSDIAEAYQEHHASTGDGNIDMGRPQDATAPAAEGGTTPGRKEGTVNEPADQGKGKRIGDEGGSPRDVQGPAEGNAQSRETGSAKLRDEQRGQRATEDGEREGDVEGSR